MTGFFSLLLLITLILHRNQAKTGLEKTEEKLAEVCSGNPPYDMIDCRWDLKSRFETPKWKAGSLGGGVVALIENNPIKYGYQLYRNCPPYPSNENMKIGKCEKKHAVDPMEVTKQKIFIKYAIPDQSGMLEALAFNYDPDVNVADKERYRFRSFSCLTDTGVGTYDILKTGTLEPHPLMEGIDGSTAADVTFFGLRNFAWGVGPKLAYTLIQHINEGRDFNQLRRDIEIFVAESAIAMREVRSLISNDLHDNNIMLPKRIVNLNDTKAISDAEKEFREGILFPVYQQDDIIGTYEIVRSWKYHLVPWLRERNVEQLEVFLHTVNDIKTIDMGFALRISKNQIQNAGGADKIDFPCFVYRAERIEDLLQIRGVTKFVQRYAQRFQELYRAQILPAVKRSETDTNTKEYVYNQFKTQFEPWLVRYSNFRRSLLSDNNELRICLRAGKLLQNTAHKSLQLLNFNYHKHAKHSKALRRNRHYYLKGLWCDMKMLDIALVSSIKWFEQEAQALTLPLSKFRITTSGLPKT